MKSQVRRGALVGAVVTTPFIAASYVGWKLFGLPFVPFDLFDWITRALPGPVVTFAIDVAVRVSAAVPLGSTADASKAAEQLMAIAVFFGGGVTAGAAVGAVLHASDESARPVGAVLGAVLGGLAVLIEQDLHRLPTRSAGSVAWMVSISVACGLAFGIVYDRAREDLAREDRAGPPGPSPALVSDERRQFLKRVGGAAALTSFAGMLWGRLMSGNRPPAGERWSARHELPNAGSMVTPVPGTRPEFTPLELHYRIDTNTRAPVIDERDWRLHIGGLVGHPLALTLDDIRGDVPMHQFVTLECVSNPVGGDLVGTTRWSGVSLQRVLARVQRDARATHVRITSADGFFETVALELIDQDPRVMLTYAWDGVPLFVEHGFPLRLYVPNLYGMKQPKWIAAIDLIDHFEAGYWVSRGWDREGRMKAASVVDTVAISAATMAADGRARVPVGGIAHAGARHIAKVELRVDDGAWQEARVREPMSATAWVVWRADIPYAAGEHTFTVRCVSDDGVLQTERLHSRRVRLP